MTHQERNDLSLKIAELLSDAGVDDPDVADAILADARSDLEYLWQRADEEYRALHPNTADAGRKD